MKKRNGKIRFHYVVIVVALFLFLPAMVQADLAVDRVTVNNIPATMLGEVQLTDEDLIGGRILVSGFTNTPEIEYSLDAGKN